MNASRWLVVGFAVVYAVWFVYSSGSMRHTRLVKEETDLVSHALRAKDDTNTVILLYASHSYRDTLFNWLVAFSRASPSSPFANANGGGVMVICLDQALKDYLEGLHWGCYLHESVRPGVALDKNTVKSLWVTRVTHVLELLQAGINVVLTDSDAVWLKDIRGTLLGDGADVVSSRANFPYKSPWGSTLCMGLVFFRANPRVELLAQSALVQTIKSQDDQVGFNHALFALKPDSAKSPKHAFGFVMDPQGKRTGHARFVLPELGEQVSVTLLANNIVARVCSSLSPSEWEDTLQVAHCHIHDGVPAATSKEKGNSHSHTEVLVRYKVFYLLPAWEELIEANRPTLRDFSHVLKLISVN
ncbi:hypothetical protein BASA81_008661 [Batrachochytrium salamandrivorans]|nr:hypothetical protein BASA81_008661 [Batrachochytrium salamandrivorans]